MFVAEDCHSASTPLKSGIRIYRRLAASTKGSSTAVYSADQQKPREMNALNPVPAAGRCDAVAGDLNTASNEAKPQNRDRVCSLADDVKVNDKEPVSIDYAASK